MSLFYGPWGLRNETRQEKLMCVLNRWAAIKMGCKIMPISPRNLINEEQVLHMVATGLVLADRIK